MIAEIKPNGTGKVRAFSVDLNDYAEFGLNEEDAPKASWARYIFGVCRETIKRGGQIQGFDTVFAGDVPLGAGMSSSAALESTYAFALNDLFSLNIDKFELAKIGQSTEHNYCGVKFGFVLIKSGCHDFFYGIIINYYASLRAPSLITTLYNLGSWPNLAV